MSRKLKHMKLPIFKSRGHKTRQYHMVQPNILIEPQLSSLQWVYGGARGGGLRSRTPITHLNEVSRRPKDPGKRLLEPDRRKVSSRCGLQARPVAAGNLGRRLPPLFPPTRRQAGPPAFALPEAGASPRPEDKRMGCGAGPASGKTRGIRRRLGAGVAGVTWLPRERRPPRGLVRIWGRHGWGGRQR